MNGSMMRNAALLALATGLAACGSDTSEAPGIAGTLGQAARAAIAQRSAPTAPQAAPDPAAMAAEAMAANPGPLIMAGLEGMGTTQVMAMVENNGGMRTYMTKNRQALILRDGMLVGTRGLGHDISSVDAAASTALVRAGRSGQAQRIVRYYAGDGKERPLPFDCKVGPGPKPGVIVEDCTGVAGLRFQNSYLLKGGRIDVSRQWAGIGLGYVTIQTIRP